MSALSDLSSAMLRKLVGTFCAGPAGLAIKIATDVAAKTSAAFNYAIGGVFYTKAAIATQSVVPTHRFNGDAVTAADPSYVQPINTTVFYVLAINAAAAVAVVQGSFANQVIKFSKDISKVWTGDGAIPAEPAGYTAFGVIKITTNGATTFTPGTTALDAAGLTVSYFNVSALPVAL